jgi:hypothetical protein
MQTGSIVASVFENITRKVVEETVRRNDSLPATEAIKLPQWHGCCQKITIETQSTISLKPNDNRRINYRSQ